MKKKLLVKILMPVLALGILIAPISPIIKIENGKFILESFIKKAEATQGCGIELEDKKIVTVTSDGVGLTFTLAIKRPGADINPEDGTITYSHGLTDIFASALIDLSGTIFGVCNEAATRDSEMNSWNGYISSDIDASADGNFYLPTGIFLIEISEIDTGNIVKTLPIDPVAAKIDIRDKVIAIGQTINGLKKDTNYIAKLIVNSQRWSHQTYKIDIGTFQTLNDNSAIGDDTTTSDTLVGGNAWAFGCNPLGAVGQVLLGAGFFNSGARANMAGCVAELTYTLWGISESVAKFSGRILDFMVFYSINGTSYTSEFLNIAWKNIRDIANIFFIIALLYIAIKTILNLNVSNNKKLIGAVIIAALLINFSFFITEIVIDASNVLAKVFYNQIRPSHVLLVAGQPINVEGQTSITEELVGNLDPQKIVSSTIYNTTNGQYSFIFVALLALAITLWMAWIFISVAFIFVSRVIMLWLCIIFSPIAFASYSFQFKIPGIGHKDWWDMLLKNAFLAPLFIFFLYITVLFTRFFPQSLIHKQEGTIGDMMNHLMHIIIPILLCFVLLIKGKKLALEYSGAMGKGVNKFVGLATGTIGVKYVGGFLAAKAGQVGRGTIGRAGSNLANKQWAKGTIFQTLGNKLAGSSFDVRNSGVYKKALSGVSAQGGVNFANYVGQGKGKGGFTQSKKDQKKKRDQRAKDLKVGPDEKLTKEVRKVERALQEMLLKHSLEINFLEKMATIARRNLNDAPAGSRQQKEAGVTLQNWKDKMTALKDGKNYEGDKKLDKNGEIEKTGENAINYGDKENNPENYTKVTTTDKDGKEQIRSISELQNTDLPDAINEVIQEDYRRIRGFIKKEEKKRDRILSYIFNPELSGSQINEDVHKMIMDLPTDNKLIKNLDRNMDQKLSSKIENFQKNQNPNTNPNTPK
ncbi:MAG: hypothetical protein ABH951_02355 [Patescibacteria group bacterium]